MNTVTVSYGEFSNDLHAKIAGRRMPTEASIELTRRCPLSCAHCYNNLPMGDVAARKNELTTEEVYRLLDELADAGTLWLLLTGGEIFARRDFLEIYTYAKRKGFLITLFTNGTLITPEIADYLIQWRPFAIEITLYGRTKETYERLTGVAGSYEKCLRGINLLLERKLPLKLKSVAVSINQHEIFAMEKFAEELGVEFKFDAMLNPRVDCSQSPLAVRLTPDEVVVLDLMDSRRVAEWQNFAAEFKADKYTSESHGTLYTCGGGKNSLAIDPDGLISICTLSQQEGYAWRDGDFTQGWDKLGAIRERKLTLQTKCVSCRIKSLCGMCPATAELENGNPETPVDFLCQVAHLRAYSMDMEIPSHGDDCEYCHGGHETKNMQTRAAAALRQAEQRLATDAASTRSRYLPVLASKSGNSGGCNACA